MKSHSKQKQLYVVCLARAFAIGYKGKSFIYAHEASGCIKKWARSHANKALEGLLLSVSPIPIHKVKESDMPDKESFRILCIWYSNFINNRPSKQSYTP